MERWRGKVAVVTGASAGIGAAIVLELLKNDLIVVGIARRDDRVEALKGEVEPSKASNLHVVKADVSVNQEVINAFQWIKDNLKTVHILVNNAGIVVPGTLSDGPFESWRKTMDVNVMGLCSCTHQAIKLMKETNVNDGHIIHINSVAGHKVVAPLNPDEPMKFNVYAASKHAVTALTETLRHELRLAKLKTKITSISPGVVDTEIFAANSLDPENNICKILPHLQSKDIADAAIYALGTPPHVQVHEIIIKPIGEPF